MNWLLLRGLSREQRHWGDFPASFARTVGGAAHCLDLPGTGTEHVRPTPANIAGITEDVRCRLNLLKRAHPGPWSLFGISLGGMVAMDWVARHPADFERVVLANTSAANMSVPWKRMDYRVMPKVARAIFLKDDLARERLILSITTKLATDLDAVAATWATFQSDAPVARSVVLKQLWAASRFQAPARLPVPALILGGGRDPLMDPSCPHRLAARFGVPIEVHPEAGHELALDAPEWVAARVAAWLGTSKAAGAAA